VEGIETRTMWEDRVVGGGVEDKGGMRGGVQG
jgi:hypothetical protein